MFDPEKDKPKKETDTIENQHLLADGTVNQDYTPEDQVPRIKGLIELLNQYFANKPDQKP